MLDNEPHHNGSDYDDSPRGSGPADDSATDDATTPPRRTTRRRGAASAAGSDAEPGTEAAPVAKRTRAKATPKGVDGEAAPPARKRAAKAAASGDPEADVTGGTPTGGDTDDAPATGRTRRRRSEATFSVVEPPAIDAPGADQPVVTGRRGRAPFAAVFVAPVVELPPPADEDRAGAPDRSGRTAGSGRATTGRSAAATTRAAEAPADDDADEPRTTRSRRRNRRGADAEEAVEPATVAETDGSDDDDDDDDDEYPGESAAARRRRRRGRRGRGRGKGPLDDGTDETAEAGEADEAGADDDDPEAGETGDGLTRRRRRRRRRGSGGEEVDTEDGVVTVVKIREPRPARDEVQGVTGSTRLEAKRQRRRDGRDQRRTRPAILSESEFLARREAVDRVMAIRQKGDRTQIAVLEDGVLVEHYVARASQGTMVGNVHLGKVQNVLPSMEAAFVDIGRGRNAVLYAGEVNWDMAGLEGRARSIEQALKSGDSVLVQVTKDPVGHKGARLTSHIALSGRHLVYVPNGNASGISRKLSDVERKRLRDILKRLIPEGAGVIVRTAAEGASEDELERDVTRLQAQWSDIESKVASGGAPVQLYEEPDLVIRVVRDLFNEDFRELVIQGSEAYELVESYLSHVSPDLVARLRRHAGTTDIFAAHRIDEQILKGLDRKVFLPSGGSLVIDRTEAMTVVDVNTGKYTGTGGNLEETVTRNNLEAAEEIVRQLRLRDLGGIIVIDFIDMVLENNRELVLRRLTECLGRDRTKHQVTEITSLGLVQMTRKRIGQGLLEAFSETCEHCKGRGVIMQLEPVVEKKVPAIRVPERAEPRSEHADAAEPAGRRRGRRARGGAAEVAPDHDHEHMPDDLDADDEIELVALDEDASEGDTTAAIPAPVMSPPVVAAPQPVKSSWVNLGATPLQADPPHADEHNHTDLEPAGDFAPPEVAMLESESVDAGSGRRRSRWRLRP